MVFEYLNALCFGLKVKIPTPLLKTISSQPSILTSMRKLSSNILKCYKVIIFKHDVTLDRQTQGGLEANVPVDFGDSKISYFFHRNSSVESICLGLIVNSVFCVSHRLLQLKNM